jgi:hypothetical protein
MVCMDSVNHNIVDVIITLHIIYFGVRRATAAEFDLSKGTFFFKQNIAGP